jgi:thioredoxin:protein disulfide reductase
MRVRSAFFFPVLILGLSIPAMAQPSGKVVKVSTGEAVYKIKRGAASQIAVVLDIDEGYHINSNRPSEKFLVATAFKLDAAPGFSSTPVIYPKAKLQKFPFSAKPMSIFDGKAVLRLTLRALPAAATGQQTLKGKLTVQACNQEQCLRPQTVDVNIPIEVM